MFQHCWQLRERLEAQKVPEEEPRGKGAGGTHASGCRSQDLSRATTTGSFHRASTGQIPAEQSGGGDGRAGSAGMKPISSGGGGGRWGSRWWTDGHSNTRKGLQKRRAVSGFGGGQRGCSCQRKGFVSGPRALRVCACLCEQSVRVNVRAAGDQD